MKAMPDDSMSDAVLPAARIPANLPRASLPGPLSAMTSSTWFPLVTVAIVVLVLYLPIRSFEYSLIDDANNVYANRFICHIKAQNIGYLWRHSYYDLYMPVTDTIWALLARIAPLKTPIVMLRDNDPTYVNPAVFHCASLLFHLATTLMVFAILRRLAFRPWMCAAGALVFGAHPLQVQAVAWITGMNNLTSGLFSYVAIYAYLIQATSQAKKNHTTRYRTLYLALATFFFALALLSKPGATIIPLFVVVLETMALRRPLRQWVWPVCVWLALSLICVQVTRAASEAASSDAWSPVWGRPFIAGDALAFYLSKLLVPYNLTFDYSRNPHTVLTSWWGYVTWIFPVGVFAGLWASLHRINRFSAQTSQSIRLAAAGLLIFACGLLPTLGLVPFYSEAISTVSDRYAYLGMLGAAISVAALLSFPTAKFKLVNVFPVAYIGALCLLTFLEVPVWANIYSLTNDMLASGPNSAMAHQCYGIILGKQGKWLDALNEFKQAERLQVGVSAAVDDSIGQCLYHLKRYDDAIAHYKDAIRLEPDDNDAWFQLWLVFSRRQRLTEAEEYVRTRIQNYPDDDRAKFTLGLILMQENRPSDALPYIELAAQNEPESSDDQYYVGVIFQKLGRFKEAASYYERALDLDPTSADAAKGLTSLPAGSAEP